MGSKEKAFNYIDSRRNDMLALWQTLVNIDSGPDNKTGIDKLQNTIKAILEGDGAVVRLIEYEQAGNMLIAEIGTERSRPGVIFLGHIDTVFKTGTAKQRPFTINAGKAYGPGVLDMKGGVVAFLYAIKALNAAGFSERPIKVLLAGDEETGHAATNAAEVICQEAAGCIAAFNCETGFADNAMVIGRKGVARFDLEVRGKAAHVGNDPENGRSAIVEIAYKLIEIEKLTDWEAGITFNVGRIEGGTAPNATPDYAKITIDVRFSSVSDYPRIRKQLETITARTYVPGTETILTTGVIFKPMEATDGVKRLFTLVKEVSSESGFELPYAKQVGGGSDSAYTVSAGVSTICAMGVKGGRNHSPEEYAIVETLFERAKLLAACVMKLDTL
ncbi:M20 family metallopeptidase [Sporomusa aerivorans]|uniref:M20 family metallopeptidase n=1 Tax=Sporomusa aerivorans TaxID=204936 RepID=UPI00352AF48A